MTQPTEDEKLELETILKENGFNIDWYKVELPKIHDILPQEEAEKFINAYKEIHK